MPVRPMPKSGIRCRATGSGAEQYAPWSSTLKSYTTLWLQSAGYGAVEERGGISERVKKEFIFNAERRIERTG